MASSRPTPRREKRSRAGGIGPARRRFCYFCKENIEEVDFKSFATLHRFVSDKGKIRSRHMTGTCRRHQDQLGPAIKQARELALLPYANR